MLLTEVKLLEDKLASIFAVLLSLVKELIIKKSLLLVEAPDVTVSFTLSPSAKPASTKSISVCIVDEVVVKLIFASVLKAAADKVIVIEAALASIVSDIVPVLINLFAKYVRVPFAFP